MTWTVIGYVNSERVPAIAGTRYVAGPYDNRGAALRVFEEWRRVLGDLERIELLEDGRVVEQVQRETLLSVDEAARRLGMSKWALYARLRRRRLGVHLYGRVLVPVEHLASLR